MECDAVTVEFIGDLKEQYDALKDGADGKGELYKSIKRAIAKIKANPYVGEKFKKGQKLPSKYRLELDLQNLYWLMLSKSTGTRLVYTVDKNKVDGKIHCFCFIVEWFPDHKSYAKRFGYAVKG